MSFRDIYNTDWLLICNVYAHIYTGMDVHACRHMYRSPLITRVAIRSASISMSLTGVLGQNDVILPPPLILMDTVRDVAGFTALPQQQPQSQIPVATQKYVSYNLGPLQVNSLSELSLPPIFYFGVCYNVCFLLSGSNMVYIPTIGVCTTTNV